MISGAISLCVSLWKMAGKAMKATANWLREPHNWWRIGCLAFALAFAGSAVVAGHARQTVLLVQQRCKVEVATVAAKAQTATQAATENKAAATQCAATLVAEVGKRKAQEERARRAVDDARRREMQLERDLSEWQRIYSRRPSGCDAALAQMEEQCSIVPDS